MRRFRDELRAAYFLSEAIFVSFFSAAFLSPPAFLSSSALAALGFGRRPS
jgi:hypothetical protein